MFVSLVRGILGCTAEEEEKDIMKVREAEKDILE
jgi:hypothetical protein